MRAFAIDQATPITKRWKDKDGYLHVPGRIAASDNVQAYFAAELGLKGIDPKRVIRVYRPKAAMDAAAPTFDGKPVTLDHPTRMVDAKLWRTVTRGEAHNTTVVAEGLDAELVIRDAQAIDTIEKNERRELSAAYDFELTMSSGTSPHGQAYDAVASQIEANHIAIVRMGRSRTPDGKPCRVADSDKGDRTMRVLVFDALLLGTATATTLPEMDDGAATAVDTIVRSLATARDAAIKECDAVMKEAAERLEAQAKDHATAMKALEDGLPARVQTEAADIASVLAGAASLGIALKAEGKDALGLRREFLTEATKDVGRKAVFDAMVPDPAKLDATTARLAVAALLATAAGKKPARAHDALGAAISGRRTTAGAEQPAAVGRAAAIESSANAWKRDKK